MSKLAKALTAAAGNAGESLYVEDVFSTYLYTGTGTARTITNDVDLAGEGGLVWIKERSDTGQHHLYDTERGATKRIHSNSTAAEATQSDALTAFNSDGFTLGGNSQVNDSGEDTCSWTFRKAEKFFDVVTYTGNSTAGRTVSHNLGSVPAVIIVKKTSSASSSNWYVYHSSLGSSAHILLNTTSAADTSSSGWNSTNPTATEFTLGNNVNVNASGESFVAYLFASDAGGFGDDGSENIIKCGSYTGNGSSDGTEVDLGFEPQWLLVKGASSGAAYSWALFDNMRGVTVGSGDVYLEANTSNAESSPSEQLEFNATGFKLKTTGAARNASGQTYIYIAIRRPMKTPESGTEVFDINTADGATSPQFKTSSAGPIDTILSGLTTGFTGTLSSRLTGTGFLKTASTDAELTNSTRVFDYMNGYGSSATVNSNFYGWMFKRATGFFDVVAYTGDGSGTRNISHNLGVAPKIIILKPRSAGSWYVYVEDILSSDPNGILDLSDTAPSSDFNGIGIFGNNSTIVSPTDSVFTTTSYNSSGTNYIAYLFASLDGVSKVGSYTGTGSNVDVDCGFAAGARFILIKRTDSTGDWYVWDSARGIVAGNDPYLLLNSTAAEVTSTDYIDPLASGFTVTSSAPAALNASGGTYIFLAIA